MRVTVIGLGYLGLVHAATLAAMGNQVLGMDIDESKVNRIKAGDIPFYEPGLNDLITEHVNDGSLQFTANILEVAKFAGQHFLCVGTPLTPAGLVDLHYLFEAVETLVPHLKGPENFIIGKSTTPPGTAAKLLKTARRLASDETYVDIAWNPEFLREGSAIADSLYPSRLVFGVNNKRAEMVLRQIYSYLISSFTQPCVTDVETSEMAKLASNAFLATKISFINGIAQFCEANGGNVQDIARIMGLDSRIGMVGLQPGLGWGGGCLPKDVQMLTREADTKHANRLAGLLKYATRINYWRRHQVIDTAEKLLHGVEGQKITILGAAFKAGTDDLRDSPGLYIADQLIGMGAFVVLHDPKANITGHYTWTTKLQDAIQDADLVILATDHPEYANIDPSLFHPSMIIDGRYALNRKVWEAAGWKYHEVGR
jgi:UDPglucose 6-dehydrogenase